MSLFRDSQYNLITPGSCSLEKEKASRGSCQSLCFIESCETNVGLKRSHRERFLLTRPEDKHRSGFLLVPRSSLLKQKPGDAGRKARGNCDVGVFASTRRLIQVRNTYSSHSVSAKTLYKCWRERSWRIFGNSRLADCGGNLLARINLQCGWNLPVWLKKKMI